tara:strand:+ start:4539 stop:4766 length:228 start_codon:yes stop_codon:yes gene_type:complete
MSCCGRKEKFKKTLEKRFKRDTSINGIPYALVEDDKLQPVQRRAKHRAIRIKSRQDRILTRKLRIDKRNANKNNS